MKIVYLCSEYPPAAAGGLGVFVETLAKRLSAMGHEVGVVGRGIGPAGESMEDGVRVARAPRLARAGGKTRLFDWNEITSRREMSQAAARFANGFGADLIESYDWSGPLWMRPELPLVVRLHGAHAMTQAALGQTGGRWLRACERRNLRMADAVVSPSRLAASRTSAALGLPIRAEIIPHGIDTELFERRGLEMNPHEILYVGRMDARKGLGNLIGAFARVLDELPRTALTLIGPDSGNNLRDLLRRAPAGVRRRVRYLGSRPRAELAAYYSRAAVIVFPSRADAFGLVWAEALACGAATVVDRGCVLTEMEGGREAALTADAGDPADLAAAIAGLLRHPARRRRLGAAARWFAERRLSLGVAAERNLDFYERVIREHKRPCAVATAG